MSYLLGFDPGRISGAVVAICETGDGIVEMAEADTLAALLEALPAALFAGDMPAYDPDIIASMPVLDGEPLEVRAAVHEITESTTRITDPARLVYLQAVVEDDDELELLVAWEAAPPRQDFALGIFRRA